MDDNEISSSSQMQIAMEQSATPSVKVPTKVMDLTTGQSECSTNQVIKLNNFEEYENDLRTEIKKDSTKEIKKSINVKKKWNNNNNTIAHEISRLEYEIKKLSLQNILLRKEKEALIKLSAEGHN